MGGVVSTGIAVRILEGEIERLKEHVRACQEEATKQTLLARDMVESRDMLRHENVQLRAELRKARS